MSNGTVVILGAGAVRAAGARRSLARRPPLDCDFFEIARKVSPGLHTRVRTQLAGLVGGYAQDVAQSLEDSTTLLYLKAIDSPNQSTPHKTFLDQLRLIKEVLAATTNDLPVGPRSSLYRLIRTELKSLDRPEDLTLLTFNYDLTIERTLDELQSHKHAPYFSFPDCYRLPAGTRSTIVTASASFRTGDNLVPGIAVLKLHGSMNWQSSHRSKQPTPKALFNPSRELTVLDHPQIVHSLRWKRGQRTTHLQPIILPPVTGKRGLLHNAMGTVWKSAASALLEARRLIIFGYSCPPLDFEARMLLAENTPSDVLEELVVIDSDPAVAARFMAICGTDRATLYKSIEAYHAGV